MKNGKFLQFGFLQLFRSEVGTCTHIYLQSMTFPTYSVSGLFCNYSHNIYLHHNCELDILIEEAREDFKQTILKQL